MPCLWIRRTVGQVTQSQQKVKSARICGGLKALFFQVSPLPLSIITRCSRTSQNSQMLKKNSITLKVKNRSQSKKSLNKSRMVSLSLMSISRKMIRLRWLHKMMIMKGNKYKKTMRLKLHRVIAKTPPSKKVGSSTVCSSNNSKKNHSDSLNNKDKPSVLRNLVDGRWIILENLQETSFCRLNQLRNNRKCNRTLLE